jgi:ketosteroid isomerase-like protein
MTFIMKKNQFPLVALLLISIFQFQANNLFSQSSEEEMKAEVAKRFEDFKTAFENKDFGKFVTFYSEKGAILESTESDEWVNIKLTKDEMDLLYDDLSFRLNINKLNVFLMDDHVALVVFFINGIVTYDPTGQTAAYDKRGSQVWVMENGKWKLRHSHFSEPFGIETNVEGNH